MYEMYVISAEGYKNAQVDFLTVETAGEIWVIMKDVQSGMGVKNISDLVLKEDITKLCTQLHPPPPSSTQLISASTQLSATPSTIFEPKYCT